MNEFLKVFSFRNLPYMFLIYILGIVGIVFLGIKIIPVTLMFYLCRYDMIGYYQVRGRGRLDKLQEDEPPSYANAAYRLQDAEISVTIIGIVASFVWYVLGFRNAIFSVLSFYIPYAFGFKDVLYYLGYNDLRGLYDWTTNEDWSLVLDDKGNKIKYKWSWVYWTPVGVYITLTTKPTELNWGEYLKGVFIDHTVRTYVWTRIIKIQAAIGLLIGAYVVIFVW